MKKRKIAVVTGTRAEYGLLSDIIRRIHRDPSLQLQLVVTGQHLARPFGFTVREIVADGFPIAARVPLPLAHDSGAAIGRAMAVATAGLSRVYSRLAPDLLVLLGDRHEALAAAVAALPARIPVAHIHGGESSEGAIDEQIRHAITKLSHVHFPVTEAYRRRIVQMGEDPRRVFQFGAPGIDNLRRMKFRDRAELYRELGLPHDRPIGVVTFHPATLDPDGAAAQSRALMQALAAREDVFWVLTLPGADVGYRVIVENARRFVARHPTGALLKPSLGHLNYLSLLRHAAIVVGNSSSGIIEAPSFGVPVVNIGDRQKGRVRAANVIDVPAVTARAIGIAITRALRKGRARVVNPYAGRDTCARIVATLKRVPLGPILLKKTFRDEPRAR